MKNWQKNRNYKRVKDKDGNVVANIITVFGQDVEVSDEIFATYAQVDRRARYVGEDMPAQHELSLEQFEEEGVSLEKLIRETAPSAEEWFMEQEESNTKAERPYFAQYEKIFFKRLKKTVSTGRYSGGISERNKYFLSLFLDN